MIKPRIKKISGMWWATTQGGYIAAGVTPKAAFERLKEKIEDEKIHSKIDDMKKKFRQYQQIFEDFRKPML